MIDFIATILLLFEAKLYFCSVWWNGRAWVVLWRGTSCCPSLGIVPSLVARAEVSQRIRDLWAFLRHLLSVLKSAGACPAPHHWISGIWGFFPSSQWRDPFGVSLVSLCTLLLFVRRSRANPFFLPFHCHFWGETDLEPQYVEQVQAVIAAELFFCCRLLHRTTHDLPLPFNTLKNPCTKTTQKNPGSAAWQNCLYPQRSCLGTRGDEQAVSCTNYSHR